MSRASTNREVLAVLGHFLSSQPQLTVPVWTERFPLMFGGLGEFRVVFFI